MSKICFYVMRHDTGFAPNPFHGLCTLATCTPNHMRARLSPGDMIVGVFRSGKPPAVVYAMKVDEVLDLAEYYADRRFCRKKPKLKGNWRSRAGDNIYFCDAKGNLRQDPETFYHTDKENQAKDMRGNTVFIGRQFVYFGNKAERLPGRFIPFLPASRGVKYLDETADGPAFRAFRAWQARFNPGVHGLPRDRDNALLCKCARQQSAAGCDATPRNRARTKVRPRPKAG